MINGHHENFHHFGVGNGPNGEFSSFNDETKRSSPLEIKREAKLVNGNGISTNINGCDVCTENLSSSM